MIKFDGATEYPFIYPSVSFPDSSFSEYDTDVYLGIIDNIIYQYYLQLPLEVFREAWSIEVVDAKTVLKIGQQTDIGYSTAHDIKIHLDSGIDIFDVFAQSNIIAHEIGHLLLSRYYSLNSKPFSLNKQGNNYVHIACNLQATMRDNRYWRETLVGLWRIQYLDLKKLIADQPSTDLCPPVPNAFW